MSNEVPPKKYANPVDTPAIIAKAGRIATKPKKMEPGSVILERTLSKNSEVFLPGFTPGMNPPFLFKSSAI